jgi:hypothetical protein
MKLATKAGETVEREPVTQKIERGTSTNENKDNVVNLHEQPTIPTPAREAAADISPRAEAVTEKAPQVEAKGGFAERLQEARAVNAYRGAERLEKGKKILSSILEKLTKRGGQVLENVAAVPEWVTYLKQEAFVAMQNAELDHLKGRLEIHRWKNRKLNEWADSLEQRARTGEVAPQAAELNKSVANVEQLKNQGRDASHGRVVLFDAAAAYKRSTAQEKAA